MRSQEEYALSRLKYLLGNPSLPRRKHLISIIQVANNAIKVHAQRIQDWETHRRRFVRELKR